MEGKTAKKKRKSELAGKGCLLQLLGLLCPVIGFALGPIGIGIGLVFMVILFLVGSRQSLKWTCSNCGTTLLDKSVQECPGCHAGFTT